MTNGPTIYLADNNWWTLAYEYGYTDQYYQITDVSTGNTTCSFTASSDERLKTFKGRIKDPIKIIGNIPYNITSSIIFWLIEHLDFWEEAYIMMQREVADRLVADVGTKAYGRITVVTSAYLKKEISLNIPPEVFFPKPKVHSALVKFSKANPQIISDDNFIKYNKMVKKAFSERRKMIRNTLSGYTFSTDAKDKIDFARRPETLSPEEFALLVNSLK